MTAIYSETNNKRCFYLEQLLGTPNFFRIFSARHHPVKADWSRFAPTRAVHTNHHLFTQIASARLTKIKLPVIARIIFSMVMFFSLRKKDAGWRTTDDDSFHHPLFSVIRYPLSFILFFSHHVIKHGHGCPRQNR